MNKNMIFVFGSNTKGVHGAGAAAAAYKSHGARWGKGYGHYGNSFAIPTKDRNIETMPLDEIKPFVDGFLAYAKAHPELTFQVTRIGCGLAGYGNRDIAPMFENAPKNCVFDDKWFDILGHEFYYWGTV